jgi:hypothetical protein
MEDATKNLARSLGYMERMKIKVRMEDRIEKLASALDGLEDSINETLFGPYTGFGSC